MGETITGQETRSAMNNRIRFDEPAANWEEAFPIGNGTLAGMVYGRTEVERVQLNEDSLWYGGPMERNNPDTWNQLEKLRELIFAGRIQEAEELAVSAMVGVPIGQRHYEPLGDLYITTDHKAEADAYQRGLDLQKGIAHVQYEEARTIYRREYFSSFPGQVLVVRLTADQPGQINFTLDYGRGTPLEKTPWSDIVKRPVGFHAYLDRLEFGSQGDLVARGRSGGEAGTRFCCTMRVITEGGSLTRLGGRFNVTQANAATLLVTACTDFRIAAEQLEEECTGRLDRATAQSYAELRAAHVLDYRSLFDRVELELYDSRQEDAAETSQLEERFNHVQLESLSITQRLDRLRAGYSDPALQALYFQFGRYLLIASSRPGSLPANLQGIWNKDMLPIWDSKYTININTQMNYWPAESCGLAECHEPLLTFIERIRENGRETARQMYGARGIVAHHNSDIWADTAPQDVCITATFWTMGAAWLSLHLWDHYDYNRNKEFLRQAYDTMKEAALFLIDFLVEGPERMLVTCPSSSPENRYRLENGESGALCYGPSMDSQIIRELFGRLIEATQQLEEDTEFADLLRDTLRRIPSPAIGQHGQIMEWSVDYEEIDPGHRHISHLFALHPGTQITPSSEPQLAAAARVTLGRRLQAGGGHTGWSRAWIINMFARLEDGEEAHQHLTELLCSSTLPNLLCDHPPFQIDGNFGGTAAVAEMLLQSHHAELRLLPALPKNWMNGRVKGLRARGGYEVELVWQDGELIRASVRAIESGSCILSYGQERLKLDFAQPRQVIHVQRDEAGLHVLK